MCLEFLFLPGYNLKQESANSSSKGPDSKYFQFCEPVSLSQLLNPTIATGKQPYTVVNE